MAQIPDDVIRLIRDAIDLAELVGRHVPLKRTGRSWKGCCPFHAERTPSFHVTPARESWKCYGCGKSGDCFTFLMEREGLTFPEAVQRLAAEVGVALPEDPTAVERAAQLGRLREVVERACRFYESNLRTRAGRPALDYLHQRGFTADSLDRFRLGYAPSGWRDLFNAAQKAGVTEADLIDAGLVRLKEAADGRAARTLDMFRGRVMFPICDAQGSVIAFGARTLGDGDPKYLNSPETPLFIKSKSVYGLHLAKQEMMRSGEGAVMEGYTDVVMAHQCGWPVAVAGLGTALTHEQAAQISRYVKRLYLVYDGDDAGKKAAEKNAPTYLAAAIEARVAMLPPGEDPFDTLRRGGLPALRSCLDASREAFEHVLATGAARHDLTTVPGVEQALRDVIEALRPLTNDVRRTLYVKRVSEEFGVAESAVATLLRRSR